MYRLALPAIHIRQKNGALVYINPFKWSGKVF